MKCQACNINERIGISKHCEVCITEMVKNHTSMLLNGTMEERPYGYEVDINGKPYIPNKKYILLDSETSIFLDVFGEKRYWSNITKTMDLGNVEIMWKQRTPEEKGERPYAKL